jgi:hypothetical protein
VPALLGRNRQNRKISIAAHCSVNGLMSFVTVVTREGLTPQGG